MTDTRYDATLSTAERKRHGVFYTPASIVRYLLRATRPAGPVADLSCGDGAFLVEAARLGLPVLGVDRDPEAMAQAAARLSAARAHLACGDGLSATFPWVPDVVLGNPPYLEAKKADRALKELCRRRFPTVARGGFDVFVCFLKAGLDLLPPGGRLGYIIPNKFLVAEYARALREELLATTTIEEIIDVSDLPTFRDAAVYPIMLVVRKAPPPAGHRVRTGYVTELAALDAGEVAWAEIAQSHWQRAAHQVIWLPPAAATARGLVDRLMADNAATPLAEWLDIRWAVSFHRAGLRDAFIFPAPTGRCPRRLLGGKRFHGNADVGRYSLAWSGWWIDYDEARAKALGNALPPAELFAGSKLLFAQNARRITATLDEEAYVCKDTFLVGRSRGTVSLPYLLGVLNSPLLSYLYSIVFKATHVGGAYLHYLSCYLGSLPIRLAEDPSHIAGLATTLLSSHLTVEERSAIEDCLNTAVYDLYALTAEERRMVDAAVPPAWAVVGKRRGRWNAAEHEPSC